MVMTFDAPSPLSADRLAMWVNGNIGKNGPSWMHPFHYLKQFHPKYNPKVPKNWDTVGGLWEQHADWMQNPACPTMNGYKTKSYNNGTGVVPRAQPVLLRGHAQRRPAALHRHLEHRRPCRTPTSASCSCSRASTTSASATSPRCCFATSRPCRPSKPKAKTEIVLWDGGVGHRLDLLPQLRLPQRRAAQGVPGQAVPAGALARLQPGERQQVALLRPGPCRPPAR